MTNPPSAVQTAGGARQTKQLILTQDGAQLTAPCRTNSVEVISMLVHSCTKKPAYIRPYSSLHVKCDALLTQLLAAYAHTAKCKSGRAHLKCYGTGADLRQSALQAAIASPSYFQMRRAVFKIFSAELVSRVALPYLLIHNQQFGSPKHELPLHRFS